MVTGCHSTLDVLQSCEMSGAEQDVLAWVSVAFCARHRNASTFGTLECPTFYGRLDKDADIATPAGIAVGISIVTAAPALAALEPAVAKGTGDWVRLSGLFAGAMFLVGIVLGWAECRRRAK